MGRMEHDCCPVENCGKSGSMLNRLVGWAESAPRSFYKDLTRTAVLRVKAKLTHGVKTRKLKRVRVSEKGHAKRCE